MCNLLFDKIWPWYSYLSFIQRLLIAFWVHEIIMFSPSTTISTSSWVGVSPFNLPLTMIVTTVSNQSPHHPLCYPSFLCHLQWHWAYITSLTYSHLQASWIWHTWPWSCTTWPPRLMWPNMNHKVSSTPHVQTSSLLLTWKILDQEAHNSHWEFDYSIAIFYSLGVGSFMSSTIKGSSTTSHIFQLMVFKCKHICFF